MTNVLIRVLIVEPDADLAKEIVDTISLIEDISVVGEVRDPDMGTGAVEELAPDVIILSGEYEECYELAEQVSGQYLDKALIFMTRDESREVFRRAMQAGGRDVLILPLKPLELADAIYQAYDLETKRRRKTLSTVRAAGGARAGQVWTVFSTKGGVGKTTITANLAIAMTQLKDVRVAVWDLDLHFGNLALMLNVTPRRPVHELVNEVRDLDIDLLESFMAAHGTGVRVLPSSFNPEFAEYVTGEHVEKILAILQQNYDYILVDSPSFFHGPIISAMDNADLILLVGMLDLATIYNLKSCTMVMESLNYSKSKLKLILNKANRQYGVRPRDLESTLNLSVFAEIPSDEKLALSAVNRGIPFTESNPEARISRSIQEIAKQLMGDDNEAGKRRGLGLLKSSGKGD